MKPLMILSLALLFFLVPDTKAQTFSETLVYLNEKLNEQEPIVKQGQKVEWSVSSDGKLTTKLIHRSGEIIDINSAYLKQVCIENLCIEVKRSNGSTGINEPFVLYMYEVLAPNAKRLLVFSGNDAEANKLNNAITHLVNLAKANDNYKSKDPFDY